MKTEYVLCKTSGCGKKIKVEINPLPGNYLVVSTAQSEKISFKIDSDNALSKDLEVMAIEPKPENVIMFSQQDNEGKDILNRNLFDPPDISMNTAEATEIYLTCEEGHENKYTIYL